MQPAFVTAAPFEETLTEVEKKKKLPALWAMSFKSFHEGSSAQIMHVGPYAEEQPTTARLRGEIDDRGYQSAGKHHEIYLSDPRKSAPDKSKTILRQPVRM